MLGGERILTFIKVVPIGVISPIHRYYKRFCLILPVLLSLVVTETPATAPGTSVRMHYALISESLESANGFATQQLLCGTC